MMVHFFHLDSSFKSNIFVYLVLQAIHYAKSIKIITTLTSGVSYLQPPVIVVEYAEISSSDIGKNGVIEVRQIKNLVCN